MNIRADSNSPDQTQQIGKMIGQSLLGREIILLCGELGAGKTLLTKGIAAGLAIDPNLVVSPTFTLMNRYDGRFPLFHIDLYRLGETAAIDMPEIDDHIDLGIIVVEWAQFLAHSYFGLHNSIHLDITVQGEEQRCLTLRTGLEYLATCLDQHLPRR